MPLADAEEKGVGATHLISGAVTSILVHKCGNIHKLCSHNLKDQSYRGHSEIINCTQNY